MMNWLSSLLLAVLLLAQLGSVISSDGPRCSRPNSITNGRVWLTDGGNRVNYDCRPGFLIIGYPYARCVDGRWAQPSPTCIGQSCRSLGFLDSGQLAYQYKQGQATFKCDQGYVLTGQSVLTCMGTRWNGTPPKCVGSGPKAALQGVPERESKPQWQSDSREDDVLKSHADWLRKADYSCIDGGATTLAPSAAHASTFSTWAKMEGKPRLYALYRCHWGYMPQGDNDKLYCINRQWSGPHPPMRCMPAALTADKAQSDQAKRQPVTHSDWLRTADYSCLTRTSNVRIPDVSHGQSRIRHIRLAGMPHLYVQYTCNEGYKIVGKPYLYCKNRNWVGDTPTCRSSGRSTPSWTRPAPPKNDVTTLCGRNNGGCQHVCEVQYGVKKCRCRAGYQLSSNGHACYRVTQPSRRRPGSRWRQPLRTYNHH